MSTGVPRLTGSPAAGIWVWMRALGSIGCGEACPSVSSFSRRAFSASPAVFLVMSGTLTLALAGPTATSTVTGDFFSALVPAFGVWPMIVPGLCLVSSCSFCSGSSLKLAAVSFSSALNADGWPTTFGTTSFCGESL